MMEWVQAACRLNAFDQVGFPRDSIRTPRHPGIKIQQGLVLRASTFGKEVGPELFADPRTNLSFRLFLPRARNRGPQ